MSNQSFSFKMLNRWVEESETSPLLKSKQNKEEEEIKPVLKKSEGYLLGKKIYIHS